MLFMIAGVVTVTNSISGLENQQSAGLISAEVKLARINEVIAGVSKQSKTVLLVCMCLIPVAFMTVALILYKKKCILNEKKMSEMMAEIADRKEMEEDEEPNEIAVAPDAENVLCEDKEVCENAEPFAEESPIDDAVSEEVSAECEVGDGQIAECEVRSLLEDKVRGNPETDIE